MMELYILPAVVWFVVGAVVASVVWLALFGVLVYLAMRAKARREREPEPKAVKDNLYVDSDTGSDANDGRSVETAMATVAAAVDVAGQNDQIVVFCGNEEE